MLLSVNEQMFTQEVLKSSSPVLVHFWAPWCGLCKLIMPQLCQFQQDWRGTIKVVGVNADQSLKLANTYRLQTLPTLIIFDRGQVLYRLEHFQGREDLRRRLDSFMVSDLNYQQIRQAQEVLPLEV
ncbi:thioredoxin family protein [Planktothrix agardhii]|nr:thioredoxin domain-containing protein [Planktothrix agardhii]MBG0745401.1 redoxin domain-containing protein [Planktothrix agardhii KL2]MCB8759907.1 redoxin domain-containing protein [Planktothrix agardhii 1813]MCB8777988.1 redoxin domain-containing protein [Planktothrix agardhii 1031]MCB8786667.1 redoxin domain-containing protein [Planktothrix agardhii 1025]MCF3575601.1 thioredoxin domain-containing protein [Planktothrix agardhii 1812]